MVRVCVNLGVVALAFLIAAFTQHLSPVHATCVFDSDFGFKLNCAFKQSGIFRVRNLGGVKGYLGLGLSVGDELGFGQSLTNVEPNRRRSTSGGGLAAAAATAQQVASEVPPFKKLDPNMPILRSVPPKSRATNGAVPPFMTLPMEANRRTSSMSKLSGVRAQTAFRNAINTVNRQFMKPQSRIDGGIVSTNELTTRTLAPSKPKVQETMEAALERNIDALAKASNLTKEAIRNALGNKSTKQQLQQASAAVALLGSTTTPPVAASLISTNTVPVTARTVPITTRSAPIIVRTIPVVQVTTSSTTTTTTTERSEPKLTVPPKPLPQRIALSGRPQVMNAPKEYYPVGYDKNFDDQFKTRVELPPTSFTCGDQKHFPGLYADEDLGCMVFHVCALTDDGLIQKSFLCPENTLFDQSVLKCNWWFYVDCPSSRTLYDSNIPVSKSYQLMKALAFFSALNKP